MTIVSGFADISIFQLLLVALMALFASIIGGSRRLRHRRL
ncbi:hypothetical protein ACVWW2_002733 [Bradyrhizobium sp. LM4.3]